jgi:hypothetical protein
MKAPRDFAACIASDETFKKILVLYDLLALNGRPPGMRSHLGRIPIVFLMGRHKRTNRRRTDRFLAPTLPQLWMRWSFAGKPTPI